MSHDQHIHQLTDGKLICDNQHCREKVLERIEGIKNDFDEIVQQNSKNEKINHKQAWKIVCLTSQKLSDRLVSLLKQQEIRDIIEKFLEHNNTKQAFDKALESTKFLTKDQLWNIYMNLCRNAVNILSKTKKDRRKYIGNFMIFDENQL